MKDFTDIQLMDMMQQDNEASPAFHELYNRYSSKLLAIALKKTGSKDDALDIVQELFMGLWNKRKTLQINSSPAAYLVVSVNYMAIRYYKQQQLRPDARDILPEPEIANEAPSLQKMLLSELNGIVLQEVKLMPTQMQQIYLFSREEDMSGSAIAEALSISHQTVRNQISLALKRIKQAVQLYTSK